MNDKVVQNDERMDSRIHRRAGAWYVPCAQGSSR